MTRFSRPVVWPKEPSNTIPKYLEPMVGKDICYRDPQFTVAGGFTFATVLRVAFKKGCWRYLVEGSRTGINVRLAEEYNPAKNAEHASRPLRDADLQREFEEMAADGYDFKEMRYV